VYNRYYREKEGKDGVYGEYNAEEKRKEI